ncbi:MAG: HAMP domain-containing histidine kinase [Clostridium argentinense]|uniref:histidine kinase n=1 Tax=Clostridium faecium TaxID=2762223 RepID=A0ABR8YPG1_9CLOT|nr:MULTISPECIES: HAMP domain-containing sensor histidine kinase [Clostridium]MBD8045911.1 HAMP domain-containing histidine kinase [Clostridium faecium]MBS5822550.1 HAMP domain-containing histidine kinase [Clostridium argentinense]MDU1347989.1 HAMP domain-containing sensor histidine kinase [Clostridium argentinense]
MVSIKKRISGSYLLIILLTIVIVEVIVITAIRSYYYTGLNDTLKNQIIISSNFYNTYLSSEGVQANIANNVDLFWENTNAEVQVIDKNGKVLMDSLGVNTENIKLPEKLSDVIEGKEKIIVEKLNINGESSISMVTALNHNNKIDGALRFIASTIEVDKTIAKASKYALLVGMFVIMISSIVSLFISNSITKPLKKISYGAEKMATGDFSEKIPKFFDDELGKLADTLNYMSDEIMKNEKLKNEFIASVSHELRTPLTSIKGWSIVLKSSDFQDEEEIKEGLDIIEQEVDRLTHLVEDLLDFSKLLSGKITLKKESTNLTGLILTLSRQLAPRAKNENLTLKINVEENLPDVIVDKNRIKQVFINILDNAIKFTSPGGEIFLSASVVENYIKISIKDTGAGISEEDIIKVKEKFYKGKNSNSSNGIGLSVCDEIIQMHNGTLDIKSKLGEGTEVIVTLPI